MRQPDQQQDPAEQSDPVLHVDPVPEEVISERRLLINLAYRLLGSVTEAEDAVQETYLRWYSLSEDQRARIQVPNAWLTKVASRICLDVLSSARARRERYVGEWLPEPLPDSSLWSSAGAPVGSDPVERVTLDESVTMAFLVVLESMTPAERVAFVLHDVFRYSFAEIGEVVGRSVEASRQLASSARNRVHSSNLPSASTERHAGAVRAFRLAWQSHDIEALRCRS